LSAINPGWSIAPPDKLPLFGAAGQDFSIDIRFALTEPSSDLLWTGHANINSAARALRRPVARDPL
jgi:hypothetical protein